MDSGNSGSLQSSSGGDEEFDSRAESFSSFLNPTGHFAPMSNPPQPLPPPPPHRNPNSSMLDPLLNFFDPLSQPSQSPLVSPNPLLNDDTAWSKTLRSDPICTGQINPSMASPPSDRPFVGSFTSSSPMVPFPLAAETTTPRLSPPSLSAAAVTDQTHVGRNPKKRSRASRRAPTTVLTTDTTNFRAMVQEFTGIPAPPFTSSPFPRSRLDLFGAPSSMRSIPSSLAASQPPSYILRPFPQKFQLPPPPPPPPPFVSSFALSSSFLSSTTATKTTTPASSASNSTSINYRLPSELGLLNMQNQILTFQSCLQSAPKYPLSNSPLLRSKTQELLERNQSNEFGLSHTQITGLPNNLLPSGGTISKNQNNWAADRGVGFNNNGDQSHLMVRPVNGNFDYSEKASENVSTRGDPPLTESWVCSSDPR